MGTSNWQTLPFCIEVLMGISPQKVLDVGVGFGRWGAVTREFCELWQERVHSSTWQIQIEGIEVFPDNIDSWHSAFYNRIHIGDARDLLRQLEGPWDVIIFGDVMEHFERAEALELLQVCLAKSAYVLVNIPIGSGYEQGEKYGNTYETHLSRWEVEDFRVPEARCARLVLDAYGRMYLSVVLSKTDPKGLGAAFGLQVALEESENSLGKTGQELLSRAGEFADAARGDAIRLADAERRRAALQQKVQYLEANIVQLEASFLWRTLKRCNRWGVFWLPRQMLRFGRYVTGRSRPAGSSQSLPVAPAPAVASIRTPDISARSSGSLPVADITLVLISRNRSQQLRSVLPAIAANTVLPSEVLLVDDASDDDTVDVFESLCRLLKLPGRVIRHAPGGTFRINTMRNAGLHASSTEQVILLDADLVPSLTYVAAHLRMLSRGHKVISTGPRLEAANSDGTGPVNFMWGHEPYACVSPNPDQPLPWWSLVAGSNTGYHRGFVQEVGLFDLDYDGGYGYDDVDFHCRAAKRGAVYYGDFQAHAIHLPHEMCSSVDLKHRNAELFRQKNGQNLAYPSFAAAVGYSENWAKRYARFLETHTVSLRGGMANDLIEGWTTKPTDSQLLHDFIPPAVGEPCMMATRWAATNVGGRFLIKLAIEKLSGRLSRLWRKA